MISFLLLPNLTFFEFLCFQIIQTTFHFIFVVSLLYLGLLVIHKDKNQIKTKRALMTGLILEISEGIIAFYGSFLLIGGGVTMLFIILLNLVAEFVILYLRYYERKVISERQLILLFIVMFIPAFIVSLMLTNLVFGAFGIPNALFLKFI